MKTIKNQNTLVEEIHNAFNNAGESLLVEANKIIASIGEDTVRKAERLHKIGFTASYEVNKINHIRITRELATTVKYYQQKYPLQKFITDEQVKKICNKYNLVCAGVDRYTGFVPEIKLKQIEDFVFDKTDKRELVATNLKWWSISDSRVKKEMALEYPEGIYPINRITMQLLKRDGSSFSENVWVKKFDLIGNETTLICAPAKDMNLKGLKKIGAIFMSTITIQAPDPVVLQPCRGGYLILAAWGDEASDENVVNQINN